MSPSPDRKRAVVTLVGFHDLLGFGELVAASGGTLDSAVGDIAYRRIEALQASIDQVKASFPRGTMFFHFNDTVTAYLDVDLPIISSHTDPEGISAAPISKSMAETILHFVSGCANLHQQCIAREEEERLGPAGRTFVVLGRRWQLSSIRNSQVFDVAPLQANLAFSEAYLADTAGARAGFSHRTHNRLYVNDYLWFVLTPAYAALTPPQQRCLATLGDQSQSFPRNLCPPNATAVTVDIFHRRRSFYSLVSHDTSKMFRAIDKVRPANH